MSRSMRSEASNTRCGSISSIAGKTLRAVATEPTQRVIEVTGLPGAGKSTVCEGLLAAERDAKRCWVGSRRRWLRHSLAQKLLLPVVFFRYRRVLRILVESEQQGSARCPRLRALSRLLFWSPKRLNRSRDPLLSVSFLLSVFVIEFDAARLEARMRRRVLVSDEGWVHRALGIWQRVDPRDRTRVLDAYLDTIPYAATTFVLRTDPAMAAARAAGRARGVPRSVSRAAGHDGQEAPDAKKIDEVYEGLANFLESPELQRRVSIRTLDARNPTGEVIDQLRKALGEMQAKGPFLVFCRT